MGINELKEVLGLVFAIVGVVDEIGSQKLGGLAAVLKFLPLIPKVSPALKDVALVVPELKDLSEDERNELKAFVVSEFNIANDQVEVAIESVLCVAIDLSVLLRLLPKA